MVTFTIEVSDDVAPLIARAAAHGNFTPEEYLRVLAETACRGGRSAELNQKVQKVRDGAEFATLMAEHDTHSAALQRGIIPLGERELYVEPLETPVNPAPLAPE